MIWILLFIFAQGPSARAESPHLPVEMQQKVDDMSAALHQGYLEAQKKLHQSEKDSSVVHSIADGVMHLWTGAKAKGRRALVYLDHQLHEHVLGPEEEALKAQ